MQLAPPVELQGLVADVVRFALHHQRASDVVAQANNKRGALPGARARIAMRPELGVPVDCNRGGNWAVGPYGALQPQQRLQQPGQLCIGVGQAEGRRKEADSEAVPWCLSPRGVLEELGPAARGIGPASIAV